MKKVLKYIVTALMASFILVVIVINVTRGLSRSISLPETFKYSYQGESLEEYVLIENKYTNKIRACMNKALDDLMAKLGDYDSHHYYFPMSTGGNIDNNATEDTIAGHVDIYGVVINKFLKNKNPRDRRFINNYVCVFDDNVEIFYLHTI